MFDFLLWVLKIAWSILVLWGGFMLLKYLIRNGGDTFRDIMETIGTGIRAGCLKLKMHWVNQIRKERGDDEEREEEPVIEIK